MIQNAGNNFSKKTYGVPHLVAFDPLTAAGAVDGGRLEGQLDDPAGRAGLVVVRVGVLHLSLGTGSLALGSLEGRRPQLAQVLLDLVVGEGFQQGCPRVCLQTAEEMC